MPPPATPNDPAPTPSAPTIPNLIDIKPPEVKPTLNRISSMISLIEGLNPGLGKELEGAYAVYLETASVAEILTFGTAFAPAALACVPLAEICAAGIAVAGAGALWAILKNVIVPNHQPFQEVFPIASPSPSVQPGVPIAPHLGQGHESIDIVKIGPIASGGIPISDHKPQTILTSKLDDWMKAEQAKQLPPTILTPQQEQELEYQERKARIFAEATLDPKDLAKLLGDTGQRSGNIVSKEEADRLAKEWVGDGYRIVHDKKFDTLISKDGSIRARTTSWKPTEDAYQINLETWKNNIRIQNYHVNVNLPKPSSNKK